MTASPVQAIGRHGIEFLQRVGSLFVTLFRILQSLVPPRFDAYELLRQLERIGVQSIPIVIVTAFLTGIIMVVQTATYVHKTGATSFTALVAGVAVLSELGPALIGIMFSGRVGANTTAEFGTMVVSEQMDALRSLAVNPMRFLVVPRFIAILISLVLLTVIGDIFGILGGMATSHLLLGVHWTSFVNSLLEAGLLDELVVGLIKALFFGMVISVVSTSYGLSVKGGARGVGMAVNGCVVTTALGIFLFDYIITWGWYRWMG
jgi:phospholipid/cholesterol/gamma-HCH transport system permease protein